MCEIIQVVYQQEPVTAGTKVNLHHSRKNMETNKYKNRFAAARFGVFVSLNLLGESGSGKEAYDVLGPVGKFSLQLLPQAFQSPARASTAFRTHLGWSRLAHTEDIDNP